MFGILQFSRRETIGYKNNGIRFKSLNDNTTCVVTTKVRSFVDRWAKINKDTHELIEIYGNVGDYHTESVILQRAMNILPCKYPSYNYIINKSKSLYPYTDTFTVDNESTNDMDDALTIFIDNNNNINLGIHIIDVASFINNNINKKDKEVLLQWVFRRCGSTYFDDSTIPMLPKHLAHEVLSIKPNEERDVISLWITFGVDYKIQKYEWKTETIMSSSKLSYDNFVTEKYKEYEILSKICDNEDPHEIIAWTMKIYNMMFTELIENKNKGILRVRPDDLSSASYEIFDSTKSQNHIDVNNTMYTHATSPIRRCIDLFNQFVYHDIDTIDIDINIINQRMNEISMFHRKHAILELSHKTRNTPVNVKIKEYNQSKNLVIVEYDNRRYRIPRYDSFYDGDFEDDEVELWGILKNGISTLRIRNKQTPLTSIETFVEEKVYDPIDSILTKEYIEDIMGYPIDEFQSNCLNVINKNKDLFGTAPTGSGKTTVAMMGILKAFTSNKRAIFSSPIKALSNEKYADMKQRLNGRVSLLTGDLKVRCAPSGGDGSPELLIMTAEILRNKLNVPDDLDLKNVSMLIVDECHYINDPDRGPVWEETLLSLPKHIQVVALSATLSLPEEFTKWLSHRRDTECVLHSQRHVPLHIGSIIDDKFIEMTNTNKIKQKLGVDHYYWKDPCKKSASPTVLVDLLIKNDMIPSIVFCMSRARCVQMAESFTKSLMVSKRPIKNINDNDFDKVIYEANLKDWNDEVLSHKRKFDFYVKKYLKTWGQDLEDLPEYKGFIEMLYKGVAYHHSGMIPVLREFVEILFREKMIVAVFATESLGVGIDMPARTTVFTQLTKPTMNGHRNLYTQEFMQMAGRAGRRGKDTKGFVVYYPYPEGKGGIPYGEFSTMVMGSPPRAESQLVINKDFVVRNYNKHLSHLNKSLLSFNLQKEIQTNQITYKNMDTIIHIAELNNKLNGSSNGFSSQITIKVNKKQQKNLKDELNKNLNKLSLTLDQALQIYNTYATNSHKNSFIQNEWSSSIQSLRSMGVIDDNGLTSIGKIAAIMCDGYPLTRAFMIHFNMLNKLSMEEIVCWLGLFSWSMRDNDDETDTDRSGFSDDMITLINSTIDYCDGIYNKEIKNVYNKLSIMMDWIMNKNITNVVQYTGLAEFGNFVKTVLRTVSYVEELRTILLSIENYQVYNRLENFEERIFYGLVSNASIYVEY